MEYDARAEVERVLADDRRYGRRESVAGWIFVALGVGLATGAALWVARGAGPIENALWLLLLGFVLPVLVPLVVFRPLASRHNRAVLGQIRAVDEPVAVVEALQTIVEEMRLSRNMEQVTAVEAALLDNLSAADAQRLSPRWPRIVHRILMGATDPLRMLDPQQRRSMRPAPYARLAGMIGDASHVQPLKRLAEMRPRGAEQEAIRLEAEKALSALLARLDASGDRLLRPASGEAETLLRPTEAAEPELLLRPATQDAETTEATQDAR